MRLGAILISSGDRVKVVYRLSWRLPIKMSQGSECFLGDLGIRKVQNQHSQNCRHHVPNLLNTPRLLLGIFELIRYFGNTCHTIWFTKCSYLTTKLISIVSNPLNRVSNIWDILDMDNSLLPGQMSPWQLESVLYVARNLPLKFDQNRGINTWDMADIEFVWVGWGMQSHFQG